MSKTFDFTYFFKDHSDLEAQLEKWRSLDLRRVVIGRETAPETGKEHLQGKVTFIRNYRLTQLHKLFPGYHIEKSIVTNDFNYCMKENVVLSRDERQQGSRNDLKTAMELVKNKRPRLELMEACPTAVARYEPFLNSYRAELDVHEGPREVFWVHGQTGSGKTRAFWDHFPDGVSVEIKNNFFNGYTGQRHVLLDDFRSSSLAFHDLLKVLDRYPYTANVKGGTIRWNAAVIFITSPLGPRDCYIIAGEDILQLTRRITHTFEFPQDVDECVRALRARADAPQESAH